MIYKLYYKKKVVTGMKYKEIIEKMTLEEKAKLCVGKDYWHSLNIERLKIPSITMSDGPHGLRVQKEKADNLGINESEISTCFPASSTVANSWNRNMAYKLGKALGEEASYEDVDIVLGPAINMKRSPLCGRNFEYFSEDPYLTGVMGTEYVKGLQENNVGACVKHFAANNQENRRRTINTVVDERTLREIYLKAFEMIVENAKPWSIMSAYNKLNDKYCTENKELMDILKKEWNFDGIVITDWGAENNRVEGLLAGNEIEMPGGRGEGANEIVQEVKDKRISEEYLNVIVDRILNIAFKAKQRKNLEQYDREEHHRIAQEIAEDSIVLLKNEDEILPLKKSKIAVIGDMAVNPRYQGAGSSTINPYRLENAYDCLKEENIEITYAKGYGRIETKEDEQYIKEAVELAKVNETVLIFAGLTENYESEGMDRTTLDLPNNQNKLIEEISKVNKNIVVVLANGSPITMPWREKVKAIITGYLGGEAGARAMVNCLIGKVNPSGKLTETYPKRLEDTPCFKNYPGTEVSVEYQEAIYIGYRYYDKNDVDVLYPFGYGLSYTKFDYSNLKIEQSEEKVEVSFKIKNVGNKKGKEIAQLYIGEQNPVIFKANKELKGFEKVELEVGEEKEVKITLNKDAFSYYNVESKSWAVEQGIYNIFIGKSIKDIVLKGKIKIDSNDKNIKTKYAKNYEEGNVQSITAQEFEELLGRKVPNRTMKIEELTEENTLEQLKETKVGQEIYKHEMEKMNRLLEEQNVNKATKVMMDMQKPLKKFYEKKSSKYTKQMVEELIYIAKNNLDYENCEFVKEYLK
jgi:beta-glucosidase